MTPSNSHILQYFLAIKTKSLSNLNQPLRSKCPLSVNIHCFSLGASLLFCHLTSDTKCMTYLCLASSELAKNLCDWTTFNTACQKIIEFGGTSWKVENVLTLFVEISGCLESKWAKFFACKNDFVDLVIRDSLHLKQLFLSRKQYWLHCIIPTR